jgi:hypothetical protein
MRVTWLCRVFARALGTFVIAASLFLASPRDADAAIGDPSCGGGGAHPASVACFYGLVQFATYSQYQNSYLYLPLNYIQNYGAFFLHGTWAYSGTRAFVEMGFSRGYGYSDGFYTYRAWTTDNGVYGESIVQQWPLADASVHGYLLRYAGSNSGCYSWYFDNNLITTMCGFGYGTAISETGLETPGIGDFGQYTASTFNAYPLQWQDTNYNWIGNWSPMRYYIDNPCGQQGYSPPYCYNGVVYAQNYWADNKPQS